LLPHLGALGDGVNDLAVEDLPAQLLPNEVCDLSPPGPFVARDQKVRAEIEPPQFSPSRAFLLLLAPAGKLPLFHLLLNKVLEA